MTLCRLFKISPGIQKIVKLHNFQYRLIYNAIHVNVRLYHMKIVDSKKCTFCHAINESYQHLFFKCIKVTPIVNFITEISSVKLNYEEVSFNNVLTNPLHPTNTP